jgi:hypothetical protein
MSQIQSLLESAGEGWKNLQSDAARLANKWEKTGLLEGLGSEVNKNNMSLILENQAKQLVVEQSSTGGSANFTVGTGEQWAGIALPLVRKVFGQIAAKEFVSVQPMNLPSGLVFYLDFQYGDTKNPFTQGESLYGTKNSGNFPFETDASNLGQVNTGGLYGAGRFTYSTNQFSSSATTMTVVSSGSNQDINFDSRLTASLENNQLHVVTLPLSAIPNYDSEAVRGFVLVSGSTVNADNLVMALTKVVGSNIQFVVSASNGVITQGDNAKVFYQKQTTMSPYEVGDFEAGNDYAYPNSLSQTDIDIPEINIQMRSEAIVAKTKKLRAVWTPEFAQDLNAYQALDAEAEVTNIMSEYISLEIDLEILEMLINDAAAGTEYWSAQNNRQINTAGTEFTVDASGFYNTQGGWFQTLGTKIQKLSNKIHQLTLRGGANFMVISPAVATILESIPGYASTSDGDVTKNYAFGVQKAGSLNNRLDVYKNPYMNENLILLGYRGSQFLESGAVFAPYIPLIMTPLIYDPDTFTPRKGLLTRYAKKMIRPEFYAKLYVNGLQTL